MLFFLDPPVMIGFECLLRDLSENSFWALRIEAGEKGRLNLFVLGLR